MDLLGKALHIFRFCDAGLDQLRVAGNAGQRGLQFVADVCRELLPHLLVVLAQDAVGVDALGKGDQLFVGHILLDVVKVLGHIQHRLNEGLGQQPGQDGGGHHQCNAAQHDGRDRGIVDGPDGLGVLCHAQNLAGGQQDGVIIGLVSHGLRVADVLADTVGNGLLDLRAGEVVLHGLIGGGFKQHTAVLRDQGDAQVLRHKVGQLLRLLVGHLIARADQFGFLLQAGPGLRGERLVKNEDAQCSCEQQPQKTHQKQAIADLFFHAAQFHSSPASSSSVSL